MTSGRLSIPEPMKREVRQRCGFGCVICGKPLITYEHMTPYREVRDHTAENLTLLCDGHQRESTNGLLSREQITRANSDPINLRNGMTTPYGLNLEMSDSDPVIEIGRNSFSFGQSFAPIVIDNYAPILFRIADSELLLTLSAFDVYNDKVFQILDNEFVFPPDRSYDFTFIGRRLTVYECPGEDGVLLRLLFEPPSRVVVERAKIRLNGAILQVDDECIHIPNAAHGGALLESNWFHTPVGIVIGWSAVPPATSALSFAVDRYT